MKIFQLATKANLTLKGYYLLPKGKPKAFILFIHGLGEHSGRYTAWQQSFQQQNFAVFIFDLRGHGLSGGKPGHTPSLSALMHDIELALNFAKEKLPDCPYIIYGHSMGGNLAANFVLRKPVQPAAVILSSPYFRLAFKPPKWKLTLGKLMSNIFPTFTQPSGLEIQAISRVPEEVEKYKNDKLNHNEITARLFSEVHSAGEWALKHLPEFENPVLIIHGSGDKITDHKASQSLQCKKTHKTVQIYKDAYHELHHDTVKEDVFKDIVEWLYQLHI